MFNDYYTLEQDVKKLFNQNGGMEVLADRIKLDKIYKKILKETTGRDIGKILNNSYVGTNSFSFKLNEELGNICYEGMAITVVKDNLLLIRENGNTTDSDIKICCGLNYNAKPMVKFDGLNFEYELDSLSLEDENSQKAKVLEELFAELEIWIALTRKTNEIIKTGGTELTKLFVDLEQAIISNHEN